MVTLVSQLIIHYELFLLPTELRPYWKLAQEKVANSLHSRRTRLASLFEQLSLRDLLEGRSYLSSIVRTHRN